MALAPVKNKPVPTDKLILVRGAEMIDAVKTDYPYLSKISHTDGSQSKSIIHVEKLDQSNQI